MVDDTNHLRCVSSHESVNDYVNNGEIRSKVSIVDGVGTIIEIYTSV